MNRLERLRKDFLTMPNEEAYALIIAIREDRHVTKERPAVKKAAARTKDKELSATRQFLGQLSLEEIEEQIKALDNRATGDDDTGSSSI